MLVEISVALRPTSLWPPRAVTLTQVSPGIGGTLSFSPRLCRNTFLSCFTSRRNSRISLTVLECIGGALTTLGDHLVCSFMDTMYSESRDVIMDGSSASITTSPVSDSKYISLNPADSGMISFMIFSASSSGSIMDGSGLIAILLLISCAICLARSSRLEKSSRFFV